MPLQRKYNKTAFRLYTAKKKSNRPCAFFETVVCCWHYLLQWSCSAAIEFVQFLVSFHSVCFCVLGVFPAALQHPVRLARKSTVHTNLQGLDKNRPRVDLSTYPHTHIHSHTQMHLPLDHGLVALYLYNESALCLLYQSD